jgi:quercetin dioxygenase-like cupin family protein
MRAKLSHFVLLIAAVLAVPLSAGAADMPLVRSAGQVKWGAPPPVLPPGAKFAVISGNPAATGLVTLRLDLPAGYVIPPHFHPTDEHVTVLKGTLSVGMGDVVDKAKAVTLSPGGYVALMANMHHYAFTSTGAIIQVHMEGPFAITYVNPADDPSKATH